MKIQEDMAVQYVERGRVLSLLFAVNSNDIVL